MPIHEFQCRMCNRIFDAHQSINKMTEYTKCECGGEAKKLWTSKNLGNVRVFKPEWYNHIAQTPIFIESKKQLQTECAKRGKLSKYVEESYNRSN